MDFKKGLFIVFEGIDCCGKSTQIKLLYDKLRKENKSVVLTKEPGGSPNFGKEIREILLTKKLDPHTELFLFEADRLDHSKNVIEPELENANIVLCDRSIESTYAYQGAKGVPKRLITELNNIARPIKPDLTFIIKVPLEVCLQRIKEKTPDVFEQRGVEFYKKIHLYYESFKTKYPYIVINGTETIEYNAIGIYNTIKFLLTPTNPINNIFNRMK